MTYSNYFLVYINFDYGHPYLPILTIRQHDCSLIVNLISSLTDYTGKCTFEINITLFKYHMNT